MEQETKRCKQCGELKPIASFRPYYGGRKGRYSCCKECEKIAQRRKYLRYKGDTMSTSEAEELARIEKLYELRRAAGLATPDLRKTGPSADSIVSEQLRRLTAKEEK